MMGINGFVVWLIFSQMSASAILHRVNTIDDVDSGYRDKYYRIELLTDLGIHRYGDMKQKYDSEKYRIEPLIARTILPDSTIVEPDSSAISDVSAPEVSRAPEYSRLMMRVVTFPALQPHATIEYHYRLVRKDDRSLVSRLFGLFCKKKREPFSSSAGFQTEDPIDTVTYVLKGQDLSRMIYHLTGDVEMQKFGDTMIVWRKTDVPPILREEGMVPIEDIAPRLVVSEFRSWDSVASYLYENFKKPLLQKDRSIVDAVFGRSSPPGGDSAIMAAYNYVLHDIRTVPVKFGDVGYEPTPPSTVNKHRYGDPKDKAVLLASLLRMLGFDATPLAVRKSDSKFVPEVPTPEQFDHVIVAVHNGDSTIYLDPTARFTRYGYLPSYLMGKYALPIRPGGEVFKLPARDFSTNRATATWDIKLSPNGSIDGKLEYRPQGQFEEKLRYEFFGKTRELTTMKFRSYADRIARGSELVDYSITDVNDIFTPATASMEVRVPEYGVVESDVMILELPGVVFQPRILHISLRERRYPLKADGPFEVSYTWKIQLPRGYRLTYAPDYSDSNEIGMVSITHSIDGNTLKVKKVLRIFRERVNPDEYGLYRTLGRQFVSESSNIVLLEKVGE